MLYFTVGPSQLHPRFREFLEAAMEQDVPSLSHRSQRYMGLHEELGKNIKTLLAVPSEYHVFYAGFATEWMERIVQNCSSRNTLHLVCGAFSKKFYEIALELGRSAARVDCGSDGSFSVDGLPPAEPELVCLTHNETSSGIVLPRQFIADVRGKYPNALIALDVVSSAPTCDVDFSGVDLVFFSVQKGFGLPAGLGVLLAGPRAMEKSKTLTGYTGSHHSFRSLLEYEAKHQTPETPNVLNMFLLNEVCKDFLATGRERLQAEMEAKARVSWEAVEASSELSFVTTNPDFRSRTVIVVKTKDGSRAIIESIKEKGFLLGSGYGEKKDSEIRIANFPSHGMSDVRRLAEFLS